MSIGRYLLKSYAKAASRHGFEPVPKVERHGTFMAFNNLELNCSPVQFPGPGDHFLEETSAYPESAFRRDNVEFLQPPDGAAMFQAQVRSGIQNSHRIIFKRCQEEKA